MNWQIRVKILRGNKDKAHPCGFLQMSFLVGPTLFVTTFFFWGGGRARDVVH